MAIEIEILSSSTASKMDVALYYPVPDPIYSPASEDNSRQPAGVGMTVDEVQLFREGRLYEFLFSGDPSGKTSIELDDLLDTLWTNKIGAAKDEYIAKYSYVGKVRRDGTWS